MPEDGRKGIEEIFKQMEKSVQSCSDMVDLAIGIGRRYNNLIPEDIDKLSSLIGQYHRECTCLKK